MPKTREVRHVVPTIAEVAGIIYDSWKWDHHTAAADKGRGDIDGDCTDVRLVVGSRNSSWFGHWTVNIGISDYDQWHGLCAASSYDATERPTKKVCRNIARELIDEMRGLVADDKDDA